MGIGSGLGWHRGFPTWSHLAAIYLGGENSDKTRYSTFMDTSHTNKIKHMFSSIDNTVVSINDNRGKIIYILVGSRQLGE